MTDPTDEHTVEESTVRRRLLDEHRAVLAEILAVAEQIANDADEPFTDGQALATRFRRSLTDAGLLDQLPGVLETATDAAERELAAQPVAAPPYVVVTSRGPLLRGTTTDGRLVVSVRAFTVALDAGEYVRGGETPEAAISVSIIS